MEIISTKFLKHDQPYATKKTTSEDHKASNVLTQKLQFLYCVDFDPT